MFLLALLLDISQGPTNAKPAAPVRPAESARVDTVRATITAELSEDSPRTPYLFGVVTGLALDAAGRLYVSDGGELNVAVFTSVGARVTTIGRKGRGPGEFQYPTGPVVGDDGALYVRNMSSVSRFVLDTRTSALGQFDRAFAGPTFAPWMSKLPTIIDAKQRLHFPMQWGGREDWLERTSYHRYTLDGQHVDSILVPIHPTAGSVSASVQITKGGGRMLKGLNVVPFHPLPVWTVSRTGTIISSPSDQYVLRETDARGVTVREIRREVLPPPIPAREREDSARALGRRIDSLPVPIERVQGMSDEVKARRLPTTYPVFRSLSTAADGTIWARRWSSAAQRTQSWFDVLGEDGRHVRTVVVPAECATLPAPVIRGPVFACVQLDPETDAETVILASIPAGR